MHMGVKIINQCCKTIKKLIVNFELGIFVNSTLSEHLNHHECINIGTYKRGRCLFMMMNPERCTELFHDSSLCSNCRLGGFVRTNLNVV